MSISEAMQRSFVAEPFAPKDSHFLRMTKLKRLLLSHKLFHHRLAHQVRRQQSLRQNEVMKLLLVEFGPERRLHLFRKAISLV